MAKELIGASIAPNGHLTHSYNDGTTLDLGPVRGSDGADGADGLGIDRVAMQQDSGQLRLFYTDGSWRDIGVVPKGDIGVNGVGVVGFTQSEGRFVVTLSNGFTVDASLVPVAEVSNAQFVGVPLEIAKGGTGAATAGEARSALGLAAVDNTSDVDKPISSATQAALNAKAAVSHTHSKADVGLSLVDNTSDANKPVSAAQQTALNLKANLASPAFTGSPTSTTQAVTDSSTRVATTAYVNNLLTNGSTQGAAWSVPTAASGDNDNSIASTAFVQRERLMGGTFTGAISATPGALAVLTGGTTVVEYSASNRRQFELRSGANVFSVTGIPESGGDLQLDLLYTAGTLAFAQTVRWKIGGGNESTALADTGITLTVGTRYSVVLWNMGGAIYGVIA